MASPELEPSVRSHERIEGGAVNGGDPAEIPAPTAAGVRLARGAFGLCVVLDGAWLIGGTVEGWWRWAALISVVSAHLACIAMLHRVPRAVPARVVVGAVVALAAVAVTQPPEGSRDVWLYAMEGRLLGAHHVNPYLHAPSAFPSDPMLAQVAPVWRSTIAAYGPAFQAVAALGSFGYGTSALLGRLYFQLLTAAALVGSVVLLYRRRVGTWALALVGLAPAVLRTVNEAHVDLLVGAGLLFGVVLVLDARYRTAGLVLGLTVLLKANAAPAAAAVVLALLLAKRWPAVRRVGAVASVVVVAGYAAFGGLVALDPLRQQGDLTSRGSIPAWLSSVADHLGRAAPAVATEPALRSGLATAIALVAFVVIARRWRRSPDVAELAVAAGLVYLLTANYVLAWYPVAVVPLLALVRPRLAAIGLATAVLLQTVYVSPAASRLRRVPLSLVGARAAPIVAVALLGLLVATRPKPPPEPAPAPAEQPAPGSGGDRELEPDHRPAVGVSARPDPPVVALDDLADDGQAQA